MKTLDDIPEPTRGACRLLRSELARSLRDNLRAIWLYGASVFGPHTIDVDLHVVVEEPPDEAGAAAIRAAHEVVERENPGIDLDVWYVLFEDLRRRDPPTNLGPWNSGLRDDHWPLHRAHWLAGAVVVVHGLSPEGVVPPPTWPELDRALRADIADSARALAAGTPYWVLQLCRVLASLESRDVVRSKLDSGDWALERLPAERGPIIHAAMRYYSAVALPGDLDMIRSEYPAFHALMLPLLETAGRAPPP